QRMQLETGVWREVQLIWQAQNHRKHSQNGRLLPSHARFAVSYSADKIRIRHTVKEKRIGSATVRLLQGDITACEVDAVINVTGKTLVSYDEEDAPVPVQLDPEIWKDH